MEKKQKKQKMNDEDGLVPALSIESCDVNNLDTTLADNVPVDSVSKKQDTLTDALSSEGLADHAQSIIDEMEVKRKNDETLIAEFRKTMEMQTDSWCELLERSLGKVYEKNNDICQEKLQQLYTILGRINQLEQEMLAFKQSLKILYSDVEKS